MEQDRSGRPTVSHINRIELNGREGLPGVQNKYKIVYGFFFTKRVKDQTKN